MNLRNLIDRIIYYRYHIKCWGKILSKTVFFLIAQSLVWHTRQVSREVKYSVLSAGEWKKQWAHLRVATHPVFEFQGKVIGRTAWGPGRRNTLLKVCKVMENTFYFII